MQDATTDGFRIIRRIAAFVLLACLVLPFAKCTYTPFTKAGEPKAAPRAEIIYAYETIFSIINAKPNFEDAIWPISFTLVFFLPITTLLLSGTVQSWIQIVGFGTSIFALYPYFRVSTPLVGAWLALLSWCVLFVVSVITLWRYYGSTRKKQDFSLRSK